MSAMIRIRCSSTLPSRVAASSTYAIELYL